MALTHQGTGTTTVRDYTPEDREAVLSLWSRVFRASFPYLEDGPAEDDFRNYFDRVIAPGQRIWVADLGGKVIGFVSASPDEIRNLFVDSPYQRQGIGSALLATALREQSQARRVSTIATNIAARRFYEKNGFVLWRSEPHTFTRQEAAIYRLQAKP